VAASAAALGRGLEGGWAGTQRTDCWLIVTVSAGVSAWHMHALEPPDVREGVVGEPDQSRVLLPPSGCSFFTEVAVPNLVCGAPATVLTVLTES